MARPDEEALNTVIGDIYDCALNPDGWPAALARVSRAVNAAYTSLTLAQTEDGRHRMAACSPWDPEQMRRLVAKFPPSQIPGLEPVLRDAVDLPRPTLSVISEEEFHRTAFFQEWVRPQGLGEACLTKFVHTPERLGIMASAIRANREPVTADERRFFASLSPHVRRAVLIGDLIDQERLKKDRFMTTLDSLAAPVLFTSASGAILYANAEAEKMLSAKGAIGARSGVLSAQNPLATPALLAAIASAAYADTAMGASGIGLPVSRPGGPPALAYVLPLADGTARAAFRPACAAVFVSTAVPAPPPSEAALAGLFQLTQAEAHVLALIGGGMGVAKALQALGIKEDTLKTHLGRIYAKTGATRQADLVKLVSDIATPFAQETAHPSLPPA